MSGSVNYGYFSLRPTNVNTTAFFYKNKQFPVMLQGSPKTWANCVEKLFRLVQAGMFVLWVAPKSAKIGMAFGIGVGVIREAFHPKIRTADEFSLIHKIGAATFKKHSFTKSSALLGIGAAAGYTISRWMPLVPHLATPVLGFCQGFSDGALATTMGFEGLRRAFKTEVNVVLVPEAPAVTDSKAPGWLNVPDTIRWISTDGTPQARQDAQSPIYIFNGKTWEKETDQIPSYIVVNQPIAGSSGFGEDGLWRSTTDYGIWISYQDKWYAPIVDTFQSTLTVESYSETFPLMAKTTDRAEPMLFADGRWHYQVANSN